MSDWHEELLHPDLRIGLKADRILYDSKTEHQRIILFENTSFGKVLALDTIVQTTEKDEFIYHEMLAHVPILAHGAVRRVLIIGGGDGGMLEEVLKHRTVETATLVEIDPGVITFSQQYLREICGQAFEDPRADLVIADGFEFVAECADKYDLIIVDSTDPVGPGEILFTGEFYRRCKAALNPGGVLVTQNGVPFLQAAELSGTIGFLRDLFTDVGCYLATVPSYVGGPMAFGWASDDPALRAIGVEKLDVRFSSAKLDTRYYTPQVHKAAFALPPYISDLL